MWKDKFTVMGFIRTNKKIWKEHQGNGALMFFFYTFHAFVACPLDSTVLLYIYMCNCEPFNMGVPYMA